MSGVRAVRRDGQAVDQLMGVEGGHGGCGRAAVGSSGNPPERRALASTRYGLPGAAGEELQGRLYGPMRGRTPVAQGILARHASHGDAGPVVLPHRVTGALPPGPCLASN